MSVVRDEVELKALETQINEFGQVGTGGDRWGQVGGRTEIITHTGGWSDSDSNKRSAFSSGEAGMHISIR